MVKREILASVSGTGSKTTYLVRQKEVDIQEITEIENRYREGNGEPTLGDAYVQLRARWKSGQRDRETCLRLLFLAWYSCSEPACLTGLPQGTDATVLFQAVWNHLQQYASEDPEFLFVAGYMAALFPWCCGDECVWEANGRDCLRKFEKTGETLLPSIFSGRGAYGHYFAHIVSSGWIDEYMKSTIRGEQADAKKRPEGRQ